MIAALADRHVDAPPASGCLASMYASSGLIGDPFPPAPAEGAWVDIPAHRPGRADLLGWIHAAPARPLCIVTGEPGSGRTRLHGWTATALKDEPGMTVAVIPEPADRWTDRGLLRTVLAALGAEPNGRNGLELIAATRSRIAALHDGGTTPLLLIDGATFGGSQLEILQTLLSGTMPTPRVVLFGPDDLADRVRRRRSLTTRAQLLQPLPQLPAPDIAAFVAERLAAAGADETVARATFAADALRLIAEWSEGNLGLVCRVAGESLFVTLTRGEDRVDRATVSGIVRKLADEVRALSRSGRDEPGNDHPVQTRLALPLFDEGPLPPRRRGRRQR